MIADSKTTPTPAPAGPSEYDRALARRHLAECRRLLGRRGPAETRDADAPRFHCPPLTAPCGHLVIGWSQIADGLPHHHASDEECPTCSNGFRSQLAPRQPPVEATS